MSDAFNEWAAEALRDRDDRDEWERQRADDLALDRRRPSRDEMVAWFAAERRAVEAAAAEAHAAGWRVGDAREQVRLEAGDAA